MRALIVDDDAIAREVLTIFIKKYGECICVEDGQQAVEAVEKALESKAPYDLICLDIEMPKMDGHKVLLNIRKLEREQGISKTDRAKVIMATAMLDFANMRQALAEQCDAYITKPIDGQELMGKLRKLGLI
ncbi:response regulator [Candidatus Hydrogenedentota bacterium]